MSWPFKQRENSAEGSEGSALLMYGGGLALVGLMAGGVWFMLGAGDDTPPPKQVRELTVVNIVLPPPPPPATPPPMIEQPKMAESKMLDQPTAEPEKQEEEPVETPKDKSTDSAKGDEPPSKSGLEVGPGASPFAPGNPGRGGRGGGGGSRWGWYASIVQVQIESALRANDKTRNAVMQLQVRLWADSSGRISRVELASSTGNAELDAAIRTEVLGRLTLREPPPTDMPMPMVTRVTARRPS